MCVQGLSHLCGPQGALQGRWLYLTALCCQATWVPFQGGDSGGWWSGRDGGAARNPQLPEEGPSPTAVEPQILSCSAFPLLSPCTSLQDSPGLSIVFHVLPGHSSSTVPLPKYGGAGEPWRMKVMCQSTWRWKMGTKRGQDL